jgi:DNA polymerase III alpha subunit (gram-positive type)
VDSTIGKMPGTIQEFSQENFNTAWNDFTEHIRVDGTRIVSMFKSIRTELDNDDIIRIHFGNATQKDLFVQNYKQKVISFMNNRFGTRDIDVETVVDISENNEILYSDEQKFNYLVTKYPELKEFKKAFNLDIT